jgi:hypothetical protein
MIMSGAFSEGFCAGASTGDSTAVTVGVALDIVWGVLFALFSQLIKAIDPKISKIRISDFFISISLDL